MSGSPVNIDPLLARKMRAVGRTCLIAVLLIAVTTFYAHLTQQLLFASVVEGLATMKWNTALVLVLLAIAMLVRDRSASRPAQLLADAIAVFVFVLLLLTLMEYCFGINTHVDLVFYNDPVMPANGLRGRMSSATAIAGGLLAVASFLTHRSPRVHQWIATVAMTPALLALLGYAYGVASLYHIAAFSSVALNTAVAIPLLSIATLCRAPDLSLIRLLVKQSPGAIFARRLLLATVAIPLLLGLFCVQGVRQGWFETPLGLAVVALGTIVSLAAVVGYNAVRLDRSDAIRVQAERERDALLQSEHAARGRAESALAARDQLLAVVSHELRQPLTPALLATNALKARHDLHDDARADVDLIYEQIQAESRLVSNLLDMAAINQNRIRLTKASVDLNALLTTVVDVAAAEATISELHLQYDRGNPLPLITVDAKRLQQLLLNLVFNAIKFTPRGGRVTLRARPVDHAIIVDVQDSGIGFMPDEATKLFTMFEQADNSLRRQFGGMGVGLSIARFLAQLHGGTLTATSAGKNCGACFSLTLPLTESAATVSTFGPRINN